MRKDKFIRGVALAALATTAGFGLAEKAEAQAPGATTSWSGAPRTNEEDRQFKVNGRIQYDVASVDADYTANSASNPDREFTRSFARRTFIGVEGRFTEHWRYNVKFDLASGRNDTTSSGDEVKLDDAFLEYAAENFSIFIGQNNAVSHLEDRTSSNYTPFNERSSFDQAFGFGKIMGIGALFSGGNWSAGLELYGDSLNNAEVNGQDEQTAIYGRVTWAPIYQRTPDGVTLLHLGVNARTRDNGGGESAAGSGLGSLFSYSARPAVSSGTGLGSTVATSASYHQDTFYSGEIAFQWNAFGATAEYAQLSAQSATGGRSDREFTGGYVDLFWSPTGESRNYSASDGSFGRVTPRATLGADGIGHIMLSARYDWLDLADGQFTGDLGTEAGAGEQKGYVLGVTWAPIAYVKFQLNYSSYEIDRPSNAAGTTFNANDGDVDAVVLRTQFDW